MSAPIIDRAALERAAQLRELRDDYGWAREDLAHQRANPIAVVNNTRRCQQIMAEARRLVGADRPLAPPAPTYVAPTWHGHRDGRERNMRWTHPELPGIEVRHCGHPTAIRPYYVVGRPFARKYTHLATACQAALTGDEWPDQEPGSEHKPQLLIPGVQPIGDRQRIELRARRPMRGGDAPPPAGGLFDLDARAQGDLLDKRS